ncbi:MAG: class I SAM-dependent methyltransferase [Acidobacteriia bacterium]|nr:class I SAM-dependent methyltransferase [Terriglobia bacterium]
MGKAASGWLTAALRRWPHWTPRRDCWPSLGNVCPLPMCEGDLEDLPFADASFDAVTAENGVFYAEGMTAAMRELARVVRPGGRFVVTAWGPPEQCEFLTAVMPALGPQDGDWVLEATVLGDE